MRTPLSSLGAIIGLFGLLASASAHAAPLFADWESGALGTITFIVTETETEGFIQPSEDTATDPVFVAAYADVFPTLQFQSGAGPADLRAQIQFSEPLPVGAQLLAFDLDFRMEIFRIASDIGFLTLLAQGETQAGGMSQFPIYNPADGTLTSVFPGNGDNPFEYSLFDASGLSFLDISWINGGVSSGSRIVVVLPDGQPSPVPLPAGFPLVASGLVSLWCLRRRPRAT